MRFDCLLLSIIGALPLLLLLLLSTDGIRPASASLHRDKRFLLFPRSAPSRMQLISGIGIPVDLDLESLTVGYVFKAEYWLPWNVSSFYNWLDEPFKPYPIPAAGRKKREAEQNVVESADTEKSERYAVEATELEAVTLEPDQKQGRQERAWYEEDEDGEDEENSTRDADGRAYSVDDVRVQRPQNLAHSRFTLYRGLEKLATASGVPGRPCLLRSICETAEAPFTYSNGVLGELAHLIMTPSSSVDELSDHSDGEYLKAEQLGVAGEPCEQIFRDCPTSFLNKFSGVYETLNMFE